MNIFNFTEQKDSDKEYKYKVLEDSSLSKIKFASLKIAPPFYFFIHREDEQNYCWLFFVCQLL